MNNEPFLSDKDCELLKKTLLKGYSEEEQESFTRHCQRSLLDPFTKQIFATRRYTKNRDGTKSPNLVVVTSIMGLTAIAVRTGEYNGCKITWAGSDHVWRDEWLSEEFPLAAKCIVYHKHRDHPEVGIARWSGYAGTVWNQATKQYEVTDFWARLPDFMLGKVAKAQALRGAFPDQCSQIYISEELQGGISEADHEVDDELKIIENRRREAELLMDKKGVKVVSKPMTRPSAAEEAEPAFEEDKPTPPPSSAPAKPPQSPLTATPPPAAATAAPDDLDMGPEPTPPEDAEITPGGAPVESAKPWADHEILGLKNPKFYKRKVGELSVGELTAVESQWIPKVRAIWEDVNKLQQADVLAFEAAIAYYKMAKPWEG